MKYVLWLMWTGMLIPVLVWLPMDGLLMYGGVVGLLFGVHQFVIRRFSTQEAYVVFFDIIGFCDAWSNGVFVRSTDTT